jgi:hypothetical protein
MVKRMAMLRPQAAPKMKFSQKAPWICQTAKHKRAVRGETERQVWLLR